MKPVLFYILQVFVASGLLYCYYHLALRNKKFHRYNRFYLLAAVLISSLIPFLNIPIYFTEETSRSSTVFQTLQVISSPSFGVDGSNTTNQIQSYSPNPLNGAALLYILYFIVVMFFLFRILFSLRKISGIIRKYPAERFENFRFVNTDEPGTPFSFFRWLFWNRKIELNSEKGEQIFRHELFHIQQRHSWDIVFVEIISTIFWINPFFHLIKKELKAIHEFLADEFAIRENRNWQYAELLLMQALNTNNNLVNPFFHNQIKRRIAMITMSRKPRYQYLRKILVLPLAILIVSLFSFSYKEKKIEVTGEIRQPAVSWVSDTTKDLNNALIVLNGEIQEKRGIKSIDSSFNGSTILRAFIKIHHGKAAIDKYGEKGKQGVVEIIYDPKEMGIKDTSTPKPLIVIDQKPMPGLELSKIDSVVSVNDIQSISILKDKTATAKYGNNGKNGVIEISTKVKVVNANKNDLERKAEKVKYTLEQNPVGSDSNIVFHKVEIEPSFPGGERPWRQFLEKNMNVNVPLSKNAPKGTYTVVVQFIVDREGNISDLKALTNHGYGMEEECLRVMSQSPKWSPAIQNGRIVKAIRKQPMTFVIQPGTKNGPVSSNNFDPSSMNFDDPEFKRKWREMILEIKAIALKEGKAAYVYKGRTYVFGRITNPDPTIASFTEQNGTDHVFLLNDELVNSVEELNSLIKRRDVKKFGFIQKDEALKRFNRKDAIVFIETDNEIITKN